MVIDRSTGAVATVPLGAKIRASPPASYAEGPVRGQIAASIRSLIATAAVALPSLAAAEPGLPAPQVEVVARSGDPAPGTPPGVEIDWISSVVADRDGRLTFTASLLGSGNEFDAGVWQETEPGLLQLVVRTGDPAPGTDPGIVFSLFFQGLTVSGDGRIAFKGTLTGPGVNELNDFGIWATDAGGELRLVAREGQPAPGAGSPWRHGSNGQVFSDPVWSDDGRLAFRARTIGARGVWTWDATDGVALVALTGEPAPGAPQDWILSNLIAPVWEVEGSLLIRGGIIRPDRGPPPYPSEPALWRATPGGPLSVILLGLDPAPDTEAGTSFSSIAPLSLDPPAGRVAFGASLEGPSVSVFNRDGIWILEPDGSVHLLVRSFDPAPGLPDGVVVATPHSQRASGGRVLFFGGLQGGGYQAASDPALWLARGGDEDPLLLAYSAAPLAGLPTGVVPWGFADWSLGSDRLAFTALVEGPGVDASNDRAWVSMAPSGEVLMVVRSGEPLEISGSEPVVVAGGRLTVEGEEETEVVVASFFLDDGESLAARLSPGVAAAPVPGLQPWGRVGAVALLVAWVAVRRRPRPRPRRPPSSLLPRRRAIHGRLDAQPPRQHEDDQSSEPEEQDAHGARLRLAFSEGRSRPGDAEQDQQAADDHPEPGLPIDGIAPGHGQHPQSGQHHQHSLDEPHQPHGTPPPARHSRPMRSPLPFIPRPCRGPTPRTW